MSDVVLFDEYPTQCGGVLAVATLNRPKALNALNYAMIVLLAEQLTQWQQDERVVCVLIKAAGERAFCAGGDIRELYHDLKAHNDTAARIEQGTRYFGSEYRLDYLIQTYAKPILMWGHGYILGGGLGIFNGASHRVITPEVRLAMPEITIGFYPDVGATWFLGRAPGRTGLFMGLTGVQINAADALFAGLADRCLPAASLDQVVQAITAAHWQGVDCHQQLASLLRNVMPQDTTLSLPSSNLRAHFDWIQQVTDQNSLAEVIAAILDAQSEDDWIQQAQNVLRQGSPITACLAYRQFQEGRKLSLADAFRRESIMSAHCCAGAEFLEGVRALLVDKDGEPNWLYPDVAAVPDTLINQHFEMPETWSQHPLQDL